MRIKLSPVLILPAAGIVMGAVFAWNGYFTFGIWHPVRGPMPGMFPTVMGCALIVVGLIASIRLYRDQAPVFERRNWLIILAVLAVILSSFVIGILASLAIFLVLWLRFMSKLTWIKTIVTVLVMGAVIYGTFIWWLGVSFERGLLFNYLRGW